MLLYTIYDRVSGDYGPILTCKSDAVARRAFHHALRDVGHLSDYILYQVGMFEDGRIRVMSTDPVPVSLQEDDEL